MLTAALPALAQEENPLANSILLTGETALVMVGVALLLVLLFVLWTRRGPS
jgi:hypothetical protein